MSQVNRRNFLKGSLATAGAVFAISKPSGSVIGANDRINVAVSGIHSRGGTHIREFQGMDGVEVICLVDPDKGTFPGRSKEVVERGGKKPKTYQDIRKALDNKDVDVLTIATTNHWHALQTIWACQAGKDVYVEKPVSHNVHEGRVCVEAARKYNRIVQHGTQSRSSSGWWKLAEIVKKGTYGKLLVSRGLCYKRRKSIGFKPHSKPPENVDYEMWLGPAPEQPFNGNLVHYNWHWFWDFGNGDIGNQGVHEIDRSRWMIPGATWPKSVIALGGRFGYEDQAETANTQIALFDFGETQLIFEVRGLETPPFHGDTRGPILHFEEGMVVRGKFYPKGSNKAQDLPNVDVDLGPGGGHFGNFIAAVRSRKRSDLNAEILEGHRSAALCHLANVSYRVGKLVPFKPRTDIQGATDALYETLDRMEEHLVDNDVPINKIGYRLGRFLEFDAKTESIKNDPEADIMMTRQYRQPFVVPEKIT